MTSRAKRSKRKDNIVTTAVTNGSVEQVVAIDEVLEDPRLQMRQESEDEQEAAIQRYVDALEAGELLPPIEVFEVEETTDDAPAGVYCTEGHLRLEANRRANNSNIATILKGSGTFDQAVLRACGANATHGLHRSTETLKKAIVTARETLKKQGNKKPSTRDIAEVVKVSHVTVARVIKPPKPKEEKPAADVEDTGTEVEVTQTGDAPVREPRQKPIPESTGEFTQPTGPVLTDADGTALPEEHATLCQDFEAARILKAAYQALTLAVEDILEARNLISSEFHKENLQDLCDSDLAQVQQRLQRLTPHTICKHCKGEGCDKCGNNGWVTR